MHTRGDVAMLHEVAHVQPQAALVHAEVHRSDDGGQVASKRRVPEDAAAEGKDNRTEQGRLGGRSESEQMGWLRTSAQQPFGSRVSRRCHRRPARGSNHVAPHPAVVVVLVAAEFRHRYIAAEVVGGTCTGGVELRAVPPMAGRCAQGACGPAETQGRPDGTAGCHHEAEGREDSETEADVEQIFTFEVVLERLLDYGGNVCRTARIGATKAV
mmetsp:Transcript_65496/g.195818  ORF Transcript_65496/g.195818 Transcript_65496/m.195818 type:complete len:213 (+) Transcript_65496:2068-2706(+)